uniref:T3SS negative regulator,GrlR n=1 Tax=Candidatus Kentrum sp. FW TaxID=2126338 RepID=A0A450T068_9GAMM|nr:MAG: T3SS negative regulator,GrlR [Candidatus Kentron sp. FW]
MSDILDGLWTVEFQTTKNRYGRGVLIIDKERVLGGDAGYYYSGTCNIVENEIHADLTIIKYSPGDISVFGNLDHFQLKIDGKFDEYQLTATGNASEIPDVGIFIVGTKKEDLVS